MKEIGKILKERREKKRLSLAQAHAATKIQEKYLVALEEGNSKVFSAPVYYKSFLRSYAKYLKLDQDFLIRQYETSNASSDALERYDYESNGEFFVKEPQEGKEEAQGQEEEFKIWKIETKHIVAVLALVAVLLGVFFYLNSRILEPVSEISYDDKTKIQTQAVEESLPDAQVKQEIPAVKIEPVKTEPEKKEPVKTEPAKKEPVKAEPAKTEPVKTEPIKPITDFVSKPSSLLELRIEAVENVWVKIDSDGREQFQGTLLRDNSRSYKADNNFSLKIGYTPGIKVFFNNEQIDVISGSVQDVNTIFLKRE